MTVTSIYAALLVPLFILLAVRVIRLRRSLQVGIGDGGDKTLQRAVRVHANFAEYVPFTLVVIALAESVETDPMLIHILGGALLVARIVHAWGVSQSSENLTFRVIGVGTTFTVMSLAAVLAVFGAALRGLDV